MKTSILIFLFSALCINVGIATAQNVSAALQVEAIEVCHRDGGTPQTCGDLPR